MAEKYFQRFGDWDKAKMLTGNLKKDIDASNKIALKQLGLEMERQIVKKIKSQPGAWKALTEKYLESKQKKGFSGLMLVRSSSLLQSITSYADNKQAMAGVKRGKKNPEGGDVANIAAIMEYGSVKRNIPPRPFLVPVFMDIRREVLQTNYFGAMANLYLKKKYSIHK